ncbi:MAG: methyltransferase domain-containing protein [Acetobacteraceae bacterium]|nr:methyltransferase domain-containing protein [Acetobacteraceae bacterium]
MISSSGRNHLRFDFTRADPGLPHAGFSGAEPDGTWVDGDYAEVTLPLAKLAGRYLLVQVEVLAFVIDDVLPAQTVHVMLNGGEIDDWTLTQNTFRIRALVFDRAELPPGDSLTLGFAVPDCKSPAELHLNNDTRRLGLKIRAIGIEGMAERPGRDWPVHQAGRRMVGSEACKTWDERLLSGFWGRYITGPAVLDIGFRGYEGRAQPIVDGAIGIDLDYPGYDGRTLPFADNSQDAVFSSHCLEHIPAYINALQDWHRVTRIGGHLIVAVPSAQLYERRRRPPSVFNDDHQRFYTPSSLLAEFEAALPPNSYRVRFLEENDRDYKYDIGLNDHPHGCFEIVIVVQKIKIPSWKLID